MLVDKKRFSCDAKVAPPVVFMDPVKSRRGPLPVYEVNVSFRYVTIRLDAFRRD
jgi:hypothetical protein